ncbi:MAG: STAS/SEC14 domain-containing protein [Chthoniobacteraceae bacterium]
MNSTAHVDEEVHGNVLEIALHGKLNREDYEKILPDIDKAIQEHGKVRFLITMHDFHGGDAGAMWADIKWSARNLTHVQRIAIVGEKTWHKWMTALCRLCTTAHVRYYTTDQLDEAKAWVAGDEPINKTQD